MFIAFEGPDKTGKTTSARALSYDGVARYNATKLGHQILVEKHAAEPEVVVAYDRIDWFTHMVYRLALPERDWNDDRPRTVFAMPDTHLVLKLHRPDLAQHVKDELYDVGTLAQVNPLYYYFGQFMMDLNYQREFALFKSVTMVEVYNDPVYPELFSQRVVEFSSPGLEVGTQYEKLVTDDASLLELLRYADQHTIAKR